MILNGKEIQIKKQSEQKARVEKLDCVPVLTIFYVGNNPVIDQYVRVKKRYGKKIGVEVDIRRFDAHISEEELGDQIASVKNPCIVQLPLPSNFSTKHVLSSIPMQFDVDMLAQETIKEFEENKSLFVPPVARSIWDILKEYSISLEGKNIVIIGKGVLVGLPLSRLFDIYKIPYVLLDKGDDIYEHTQKADIIISGTGSAGLIKDTYIKEGVVLVDAGTSSAGGTVKGDIDMSAYKKAYAYTPVPGGIGPMTVSSLFENVIIYYERTI